MSQRMIYGVGLWVFLAAVALTMSAIALPDWISYTTSTKGDSVHVSYGLHKRCSSLTGTCTSFPQYEDCHGQNRYFCSIWRSVGFLMNFTAVIELATLVAFAVVLLGGRDKRDGGWKIVSPLLALVAVTQLVSMALVAFLFDNDGRFFTGYKLDRSWILCTVSWCVLLLDAIGITAAANIMPPEDDYEPILDRR
ncbi:hypothetical protein BDV97DRAFT_289962 [Delphinella strobiligena]|nr:hypothetical protein BDV97DRAFT_289962 [Delphinella strobiligena]